MKSRFRTIIKRVLLMGIVGVIALLGVVCLPRPVEGVYASTPVIECLCTDGTHFFRFHKERVVYHTSHDSLAILLGRYEVREDGGVLVYSIPLRPDDPEELIFTLKKPRLAFAFASGLEDDESAVLPRLPLMEEKATIIAKQEVLQTFLPDEATIVSTFYNEDHKIIRKETKIRQGPVRDEPGAGP
jgi:hypothetical protein